MRVVVIGAVAFTRRCLEAAVDAGAEVAGLLTLPPEAASLHGDYVDLQPTAERLGIPTHQIANVNDSKTVELVRSLRPDAIFVFGWSQLLRSEILGIAPCIGSHPALLPGDRGRHPITWALVDGLDETGLSFLWLDEGADSGDLLWQRSFTIGPDDDAADVYATIEDLADQAVREFVPQLSSGTAPRIPQDDRLATYRRKRNDADRMIDWRLPRRRIHNLVRGLARPYVGALASVGGQDVVVWKTRPTEAALTDAPLGGVVSLMGGGVAVRAGDGFVEILESEPEGAITPGVTLEVTR
jgi:methionyl-tRNA formyltransferase